MSAIGLPRGRDQSGVLLIGAHADFRHQDFFFPRTQSPGFRDAAWESRIRPMLSWSEILLYAAGAAGVLLVIVCFG